MATVIGYDNSAKSRIACKSSSHRVGCGAIVEYSKPDIKEYRGRDYSGGSDGRDWIVCPGCGEDITLKSW